MYMLETQILLLFYFIAKCFQQRATHASANLAWEPHSFMTLQFHYPRLCGAVVVLFMHSEVAKK